MAEVSGGIGFPYLWVIDASFGFKWCRAYFLCRFGGTYGANGHWTYSTQFLLKKK